MNTTWIRRLYDAGTRLEIRADKLIENLLWAGLIRRFRKKHGKR